VNLNNRGMTLTLNHWFISPLFSPWCAEVTLATWSERLAERFVAENSPAGSGTRGCNPPIGTPGFYY